MNRIAVELVGFGQIGKMLFRKWSAEFSPIRVVKVIDPALAGQDARVLAGLEGEPLQIDPAPVPGAEVAVVVTSSRVEEILPVIRACVAKNMSVVTSCEELFGDCPESIREIAEEAAKRDLAILGCGINPGFLMDLLPAVLSAASTGIRSILVERYQDASSRRTQFRKKIGAGLSVEEFTRRIEAGGLRHIGLEQSMRFLAGVLGWTLAEMHEEVSPVTDDGVHVRGIRQLGTGLLADGRTVITLDFLAAVGEPDPRDRIVIDGDPRVESVIRGGLNGDAGTCGVMTAAVRRIVSSKETGLLSFRDLPLMFGNGIS